MLLERYSQRCSIFSYLKTGKKKQQVEERGAKGESFYKVSDALGDVGIGLINTIDVSSESIPYSPSFINCIPSNVITFFTPVIDFFSTIFTMNKITDMATDPGVQSFYGGLNEPMIQKIYEPIPDSLQGKYSERLKRLLGN